MKIFSEYKDFNQLINSSKFFVEYDVLSSLNQEGLKTTDYVEICRRLDRPPNSHEDSEKIQVIKNLLNNRSSTGLLDLFFNSSTAPLIVNFLS